MLFQRSQAFPKSRVVRADGGPWTLEETVRWAIAHDPTQVVAIAMVEERVLSRKRKRAEVRRRAVLGARSLARVKVREAKTPTAETDRVAAGWTLALW